MGKKKRKKKSNHMSKEGMLPSSKFRPEAKMEIKLLNSIDFLKTRATDTT